MKIKYVDETGKEYINDAETFMGDVLAEASDKGESIIIDELYIAIDYATSELKWRVEIIGD